jgi:Na+/melibiose symporter-like transporter
MTTSKHQPSVLWVQVLVLAGLQGGITLSWLVYNGYLLELLPQFGFPASLAASLLVVENALAVVMEPLIGGLSDQNQRKFGSRFPFISIGVILASTLFIAISCVATFVPPSEVIGSILPLTLIAWALAMTVFPSPAFALLVKYLMPAELPLAFSFVTLAGGLIGAFPGVANTFILSLWPVWAFAIKFFVLLAAAFTLRFFHPPEIPTELQNLKTPKIPFQNLSFIFLTGFSITWGSRFLMNGLGKTLKPQFNTNDVTTIMLCIISLALAFTALPAGFCPTKVGNGRAMLGGIISTIFLIVLMVYMPPEIPTILFIAAGFSLIVNGAILFILELMPPHWPGLGIGSYFGGFTLAVSVFGYVFTLGITMIVSCIARALAFSPAIVYSILPKSQ